MYTYDTFIDSKIVDNELRGYDHNKYGYKRLMVPFKTNHIMEVAGRYLYLY